MVAVGFGAGINDIGMCCDIMMDVITGQRFFLTLRYRLIKWKSVKRGL